MRTRSRLLGVLAAAAAMSGCSSDAGRSTSATPPPPDTATTTSADEAALAAYNDFWLVTDRALAAPRQEDWTPSLQAVARGQALDSALTDVANYASLPAHTEGAVVRAPTVESSTADRVVVVDCLDISGSRVVSDTTGEVFDDLANRVPRYRFRAELVPDASGRWLVERTTPALEEPC